jgi:hypothetical protein
VQNLNVAVIPGKERSAGDEVINGKEGQTPSHVEADMQL